MLSIEGSVGMHLATTSVINWSGMVSLVSMVTVAPTLKLELIHVVQYIHNQNS